MTKIALALLFAILTLVPVVVAQLEAEESAEGAKPRRDENLWARLRRKLKT